MATSHAHRVRLPALLVALALGVTLPLLTAPAVDAGGSPEAVRFATFNASINRGAAGVALSDLSAPFDPAEPDALLRLRRNQAANVAEVIQRVRPEVLLINEFDYVDGPIEANAMTDASHPISYESSTSKQPLSGGRSEREPQITATSGEADIGRTRIRRTRRPGAA